MTTTSYLDATTDLYRDAALTPNVGLCCTTNPIWQLPDLDIPKRMQQMNYGCGSTVNARDLAKSPKILYVGVGGGMELLQFSYFSRQKGAIVGVDMVQEMLDASTENFKSGVELTLKQLKAAFEKFSVAEENPVNQKFDPHRHQAISMVESDAEANTVVSVLQKGYKLNERVIRPALVTVAKARLH